MATFENDIFKLEISQDENPINPRSLDFTDCNATKMVCFNRRYDFGDKHEYNKNDYNSWDELKKAILKNENVAVIKPLYLYDHSGITIATKPFSCPWDSGQVGFIFITKESIKSISGLKKVTKKWLENASKMIEDEVKVYDDYFTGNVWVYDFEDMKYGSTDSCSGFIGDIKDNGIFEYIPKECLIELYPQIKSEYGEIEYIEKLLRD